MKAISITIKALLVLGACLLVLSSAPLSPVNAAGGPSLTASASCSGTGTLLRFSLTGFTGQAPASIGVTVNNSIAVQARLVTNNTSSTATYEVVVPVSGTLNVTAKASGASFAISMHQTMTVNCGANSSAKLTVAAACSGANALLTFTLSGLTASTPPEFVNVTTDSGAFKAMLVSSDKGTATYQLTIPNPGSSLKVNAWVMVGGQRIGLSNSGTLTLNCGANSNAKLTVAASCNGAGTLLSFTLTGLNASTPPQFILVQIGPSPVVNAPLEAKLVSFGNGTATYQLSIPTSGSITVDAWVMINGQRVSLSNSGSFNVTCGASGNAKLTASAACSGGSSLFTFTLTGLTASTPPQYIFFTLDGNAASTGKVYQAMLVSSNRDTATYQLTVSGTGTFTVNAWASVNGQRVNITNGGSFTVTCGSNGGGGGGGGAVLSASGGPSASAPAPALAPTSGGNPGNLALLIGLGGLALVMIGGALYRFNH